MKTFLTILYLLICGFLFGQSNQTNTYIHADTCTKIKLEKNSGAVSYNPLYIANGVVTGPKDLDDSLALDFLYLKCQEAFAKFGYIAAGGAFIIKTKQIFETITPKEIRDDKQIRGKVTFALNGFLLTDPSLLISKKAIDEIEIFSSTDESNSNQTTICIWTLPKAYRRS